MYLTHNVYQHKLHVANDASIVSDFVLEIGRSDSDFPDRKAKQHGWKKTHPFPGQKIEFLETFQPQIVPRRITSAQGQNYQLSQTKSAETQKRFAVRSTQTDWPDGREVILVFNPQRAQNNPVGQAISKLRLQKLWLQADEMQAGLEVLDSRNILLDEQDQGDRGKFEWVVSRTEN